MKDLVCPKCGNDTFLIPYSEIAYGTAKKRIVMNDAGEYDEDVIDTQWDDSDYYEEHGAYSCSKCDFTFDDYDKLVTEEDYENGKKIEFLSKETEGKIT